MTIAIIQLEYSRNPQGLATGENVIYNVTHADGSVERVNRSWKTYRQPINLGRRGQVPCKTDSRLLAQLQKYAADSESQRRPTLFGKANSLLTLVREVFSTRTQIKAPNPTYVTVPQMMTATQNLEGQVKELNAKVDELTKRLAAETAQKEAITRELEITRGRLEIIEGFLKQALNVYRPT